MRCSTVLVILITSGTLFAQVLSNKPPPPDPVAAAKARAAALDVFGPQIEQAKTAAARKAVAQKIHAVANDGKESAVNRWALYALARDSYAMAGEIALAVQTIEEQARLFAITRMELVAESADKLAKVATAANSKPLLDLIYAGADEAIEADDFKSAVRLLNIGLTVARKHTKDESTIRRFELRSKTSVELQKLFNDAKNDEERGRLYCFRKGDWGRGLPLLAQSPNEGLAAVAKKDMSKPTEAKDQVDLGDAWFELAENAKTDERLAMLRRAFHWYRLGIEGIAGLAKAKAETRMGRAYAEVDAVDAKQGWFTSFEGKWSVSYSNGAKWDFTIGHDGEMIISNSNDRDGSKGFAKRLNGNTVFVWANGDVIEKPRLQGGKLILERYWAREFPRTTHATGEAVNKR